MPSFGTDLLLTPYDSGTLVFVAQQNTRILHKFVKLLRNPERARRGDVDRIVSINTLNRNGNAQFLHSGTYDELPGPLDLHLLRLQRRCRSECRKPVAEFE